MSKTTHDMSPGVGNNRYFFGVAKYFEIDIPIDLVDDDVVTTGNRRSAVDRRAFKPEFGCHGIKLCHWGIKQWLFDSREGYLCKFRVGKKHCISERK